MTNWLVKEILDDKPYWALITLVVLLFPISGILMFISRVGGRNELIFCLIVSSVLALIPFVGLISEYANHKGWLVYGIYTHR